MKRWYILAALLWNLSAAEQYALAEDGAEYRAITVEDGTVHRGLVLGSDAEFIRLKTLKGEVSVPLLEIIQVEPLSRESYLTLEGRRLIYLGVTAEPALEEKARQIDALMKKALEREDLLVLTDADLPPDRRTRLQACVDLDCKLNVLRGETLMVVHGQLERRNQQDRVTFRRFDRNQSQVGEVSLTLDNPAQQKERLATSAAVVLGEAAPPPAAQLEPAPRSQVATAPAPKKTPSPAPVPPVATEPSPAAPAPHAETRPSPTAERPDWQLDLIPVPAASSLLHYENMTNVVVSAGVIAAITGTTLYVMGDTRLLGPTFGMNVPWSHEERIGRNAVMLTGVGVVSYLATTWIVNQVVRKIQVSRDAKSHSAR